MLGMIKTVIFDLGGVIVPLDFEGARKRFANYSRLSEDEIAQRIATTTLLAEYERGELSPEEFYCQFANILSLEASLEDFQELWCGLFPSHSLIPQEWVESVRAQKRVLLLSNTNPVHYEWLRPRYPHLAHMDHHVLSYKVGAMKPDPKIYAEAIAQAGCAPEECFFTDDVLKYVEGARQAGIDAEQFLGAAKLKSDLAARGVHLE
jgi:putative hydrolase of the HAD superfamily